MTQVLLALVLAVALIYSAGAWLYGFYLVATNRIAATDEVDQHLFRLGLCAILAAGFLYLRS